MSLKNLDYLNEFINLAYDPYRPLTPCILYIGGSNLTEAFEQCAIGMFGYITELKTVTASHVTDLDIEGEDLNQLLYRFLDDLLFLFCAEPFMIPKVG